MKTMLLKGVAMIVESGITVPIASCSSGSSSSSSSSSSSRERSHNNKGCYERCSTTPTPTPTTTTTTTTFYYYPPPSGEERLGFRCILDDDETRIDPIGMGHITTKEDGRGGGGGGIGNVVVQEGGDGKVEVGEEGIGIQVDD